MRDAESDVDWPVLARYIAGECTAAEAADVDTWLGEDPQRRELLASLADAWAIAGETRPAVPADLEGAWRRMSRTIDTLAAPMPLRPRWHASPALRAAALVAVVASGVVFWQERRSSIALSAQRSYATRPAERDSITLDDGSMVLLGVASTLKVAAGFGAETREVSLEGEAFFRVRHDASKPFRVVIAGRVIEDLGTEFNVRGYAGDDTVRVFVVSGLVAMRTTVASQPPTVVRPSQLGLMTADGSVSVDSAAQATAHTGWTRGQIVFDHASLKRVADELGRRFAVKVVLANPSLAARVVSVTFDGEPLTDILEVIALAVNASVETNGSVVTFRARGDPR